MRILESLRASWFIKGSKPGSRSRRAHRLRPACETLDERRLLTTGPASATLAALTAEPSLDVMSVTSTTPSGYSPAQIGAAYGIGGITFSGGTLSGNGAGETIAIVDAYNDPNIASDLAAFDAEYGLSAPASFTVDNLGATTTSASWALETSLDVEWVHAIAPAANIVLVEASSTSMPSLMNAVTYASNLAGVDVVSMSWGSSESFNETSYDSLFTTPAGHTGVTYVAASGDTGTASGVTYPSASPNVLSVGGTTLSLSASGGYDSESAWSDGTGGYSRYESVSSYQAAALTAAGLGTGSRTNPDVSLNADPNTGYSVYDSVAYDGMSGWFTVGGTSGAAPGWAGLVAIADQGLATVGQGSLTTSTLLNELYALPSSDFNDVTSGSNGYSATSGYDLATGLGSPRAGAVIAGLLSDATGSTTTSSGSSTSSSSSSSSSSSTSGTGVTIITSSGGSITGSSGSGGTVGTIPTSPTSPTSPTKTHKHATRKKTTHSGVTRTKVVKSRAVHKKTTVAHRTATQKAAAAVAAVQIQPVSTATANASQQTDAIAAAIAALTSEEAGV